MATGRLPGVSPGLQVIRWSKAPTAGTTTLSGLDDYSVGLTYTAGYESVYLNGVLLDRGTDYTATNGTTIVLATATVAGDIVNVFGTQISPVNGSVPTSTYTTKGDILVATANNTPVRQAVGADGTVLTANSAQADGVEWAVIPDSGMTLINTTTFSAVSSQIIDTLFSSTYQNYRIVLTINAVSGTNANLLAYFRSAGADVTTNNNTENIVQYSTTITGAETGSTLEFGRSSTGYPAFSNYVIDVFNPQIAQTTSFSSNGGFVNSSGQPFQYRSFGYNFSNTQMTGIKIYPSTGTMTGEVSFYGLRK
jgi:hypothetical protein